jgi:hypothetical protein
VSEATEAAVVLLDAAIRAATAALVAEHPELVDRDEYDRTWAATDDPVAVADAVLIIGDQLRFAVLRYVAIRRAEPDRQIELPF